jgi:hypothetical protein
MTNLREAREQGRLDQFIAERKAEVGDADAVERTIASMSQKSSEVPKASAKGSRDG